MAKKFINAENLIYALGVFEKRMTDIIEKITDMAQCTKRDIDDMIAEVDGSGSGTIVNPETPKDEEATE